MLKATQHAHLRVSGQSHVPLVLRLGHPAVAMHRCSAGGELKWTREEGFVYFSGWNVTPYSVSYYSTHPFQSSSDVASSRKPFFAPCFIGVCLILPCITCSYDAASTAASRCLASRTYVDCTECLLSASLYLLSVLLCVLRNWPSKPIGFQLGLANGILGESRGRL